MLSNVREGDWVLTLQHGWLRVKGFDEEGKVVLDLPGKTYHVSYLTDGYYSGGDKHPTCFPVEQAPPELVKIYGKPPVKNFAEEVLKREVENVKGLIAQFQKHLDGLEKAIDEAKIMMEYMEDHSV